MMREVSDDRPIIDYFCARCAGHPDMIGRVSARGCAMTPEVVVGSSACEATNSNSMVGGASAREGAMARDLIERFPREVLWFDDCRMQDVSLFERYSY